ncbi:TetR/AcrR family transcriptional regulator [Kribbia dieselivorans]|uniref:TetR/AcrR family transcriptional regulator n=1 Tax=Kribbia dieselivorans TaxID=331526 RepID=UPI000838C3DB|nr:TetR/AcrR family transcriptional regulator [Kribbia dieselivorans]
MTVSDHPARTPDDLLESVTEYVAEHGVGDFSLRRCAEAIGTSHRMLSYHFGSREGLLRAVVDEVAVRSRSMLARLVGARPLTRRAAAGVVDEAVLDEDARRAAALMIEVAYLRMHTDLVGSYEDHLAAWEPLTTRQLGEGLTPAQARTRARLAMAVQLGLAYDLAVTGDTEAVAAAQRDWLDLALALDDRAVQRATQRRARPAW